MGQNTVYGFKSKDDEKKNSFWPEPEPVESKLFETWSRSRAGAEIIF